MTRPVRQKEHVDRRSRWPVTCCPGARSPEARVVYVDYDPVVVSHGRALLTVSVSP